MIDPEHIKSMVLKNAWIQIHKNSIRYLINQLICRSECVYHEYNGSGYEYNLIPPGKVQVLHCYIL